MSAENTPGPEVIDWAHLADDTEVEEKLKDVLREIHIASTQMAAMSKDEVQEAIIAHFRERGFSGLISVAVSKPNEAKQRMVMGMATSPLTEETISF